MYGYIGRAKVKGEVGEVEESFASDSLLAYWDGTFINRVIQTFFGESFSAKTSKIIEDVKGEILSATTDPL